MPGREGTPRSSSFRTIAALTAIPVVGLFVVACVLLWRQSRFLISSSQFTVSKAAIEKPRPRTTNREPRATPKAPQIVIIIDDVGFGNQHIDRAMSIDPNLNFAVLPNSTRGSEVAERLHGRGFEILCHLPMEPKNGNVSPGPNAVTTSMSDAEIEEATRSNIAAVPYARGVNNHMGSRATADRRVMTDVLRAMPGGMYFIDSRTGGRSVAADVARALNVKTATRQVFLDDVQTEASVSRQLAELSDTAKRRGVAIGIGHPHEVTLRVLAREVPGLRAKGFRFVRASEVVN